MRKRLTTLFLTAGLIGLAAALLIYATRPALLSHLFPHTVVVTEAPTAQNARNIARQPLVSFAEAVKIAAPAVVNIASTKVVAVNAHPFLSDPFFRRFFGDNLPNIPRKQMERSLGSGVIVSPDGYILTNHHVVAAAQEIQVGLHDGRIVKGHLVGSDPESDLAVVKVDAGNNLPHIIFGRSKTLQIGDVVLAIGNPFAVGQTVTMGIVSALGRSQLGINAFEDFIQTDAAINPGNSGGALIDTHGDLVGINTAIFSRDGGGFLGIGFAIPVDLAVRVMKQLIETGHVVRGWLGVGAQDLDPALVNSFRLKNDHGALVTTIVPGSPAAKVQLQAGDVIVAINGKPLQDAKDLLNTIADFKPGTQITLTIVRQGNTIQKSVQVGTRPPPRPEAPSELPEPMVPGVPGTP